MRIDGSISGVERIYPALTNAEAQTVNGPSFSDVLREQIDTLAAIQEEASLKQQQFAAGQIGDINEVVLAVQKADLALNFALQLRNKVIDAYQEISRMPV